MQSSQGGKLVLDKSTGVILILIALKLMTDPSTNKLFSSASNCIYYSA